MSELRTIELTINMNTVDSLYNDLLKLGVRNGDILLVHSSLSSLGWVCGGAQAVLMALKQAVGESDLSNALS
ncbi:Aminoglycoside 3-N-acetyltransferase [Paenibacillus sp. yr247]|uniref:AAC(3) family N-acetyltransferase n=1 Tax=Paenibacillus sp. yr247 TaxID=1761880 RepID=UPI00088BE0DB|nr:AAC(3) family N-acetyltransferase [Paenibacillus sp. yr247]SDN03097.1 Aminoglycoside 3-N-acetyltransferase [Paenibacillus sp. yr247]